MRSFGKRPATYEDLIALPEHVVGEIIEGDLIVSPRPAPRHAVASSALGMFLGGPFHAGRGGPGGWWILDEPELHFGREVLVPDLAGWRRERLPAMPDEAFFTLAPDWICEVLSPGNGRLDRVRKMRIYARERVQHAWLVDPIEKTLEVFRLEHDHLVGIATYAEAERVRALPFEALELDLSDLWPEPTVQSGQTSSD